jgi:hypothetical protein
MKTTIEDLLSIMHLNIYQEREEREIIANLLEIITYAMNNHEL